MLFLLQTAFWNGLAFGAPKKEVSTANQNVINFDFKVLEEAARYVTEDKTDLKEIPEGIQSLDGKIVKITGYFMVPADAFYNKEPIGNFAVSKSAYGCPCCNWGEPPTIFNTVIVDMKEGERIKPPFSPMVEVTGVFLVRKEQVYR